VARQHPRQQGADGLPTRLARIINSGSTAADGTPCILPTLQKTPSYDVHAPLSIESHVHNVGRAMGIDFIYNSQDITRFGMVATFTFRNPHVMRHMYTQYLRLHLHFVRTVLSI
jgi:hypothetical protein